MASRFQHWRQFVAADWSSDLNLATVSGCPARHPDELHVANLSADTNQNLAVNTRQGTLETYPVPFGSSVPFPLALDTATIDTTTGADIKVVALWYHSTKFNP